MKDASEWADFRRVRLWQIDVQEILGCNTEETTALFHAFCGVDKTTRHGQGYFLSIEDIRIMLKRVEMQFPKKQIQNLFGLSKMTVIADNDDKGQKEYERMNHIEFLEFIGRIAVIRFMGSELENVGLGEKIGYILDDLLGLIGR